MTAAIDRTVPPLLPWAGYSHWHSPFQEELNQVQPLSYFETLGAIAGQTPLKRREEEKDGRTREERYVESGQNQSDMTP